MQKVCYKMGIDTWTDLEEQCPIDISRIITYANNFDANVGVRISIHNLTRAKRALIDARGQLDLMITTLNQLLYDRNILQNPADEILQMWLMDNLGRLMRKIDKQEENLLIAHDHPTADKSVVGVSKISAYAKLLKIVSQSVIFESLIKATEEYKNLKEGKEVLGKREIIKRVKKKGDDGKIVIEETPELVDNVVEVKKNKRTFLYILFHVLQVTLFTLGSLSRNKETGSVVTKKEAINTVPTSWRNLISQRGQQNIVKAQKEDVGENVNLPPELQNQYEEDSENEDNQEVLFDETYQEDEEDEEDV